MSNMNEMLEQQMTNRLERKLKAHVRNRIIKILVPIIAISLFGVGIAIISLFSMIF